MNWKRNARMRLRPHQAERFEGDSLFAAIGRTLCAADALPRKELYESWAVCRKVLRRHRGGGVVDLAGGHGLVGFLMALLDPKTTTVTVVDQRIPKSAGRIREVLAERWPKAIEKMTWVEADLTTWPIASTDRLVGVHACGSLTDRVLDLAIANRTRVAVLPCCHAHAKLDSGGLSGWVDTDVAIDILRAERLRNAGMVVHTARIEPDITPKNRLLLGTPTSPHPSDG